jgi:glycosyltransferase involved in cell wall biosynthesis
MYEALAEAFDLAVIWISPAPANEPLPSELARLLEGHVVDRDETILAARDAYRNLALFRLVRAVGKRCDLIIASTSDSWKARVAYAAASTIQTPIAFRKERWYDRAMSPRPRGIYRRLQQRITESLECRAHGILVGGSRAASYVEGRGVRRDRIHPFRYLHPDLAAVPVDLHNADQLVARKQGRVMFLYLGRVMRQKGLRTLVEAFLALLATGRDARLLVVGGPITTDEGRGHVSVDYYDSCVELARQEPRVMFLPPAAPERVQDFYSAADVFVHPHVQRVDGVDVYDGWGNVVSEAACMGKPIIATDRVASAFDLIVDGHNGFRLPSATLDADLVRAMSRFVDDPALIPMFGRRSRQIFEHFVDPAINVASIRTVVAHARA